MNYKTAQLRFEHWRQLGKYIFLVQDLAKLFPEDSPKTRKEGLNRLVKQGLLVRACRGVYVYPHGDGGDIHILERLAAALRRGEYNYLSLESALSEYGAISQIPLDRLTIMTTGRSGTYRTPFGTIEFTHTKRPVRELLMRMVDTGRPLRVATREAAWSDLKRVGRNRHLVDMEALHAD